jgi:hypothetical protein
MHGHRGIRIECFRIRQEAQGSCGVVLTMCSSEVTQRKTGIEQHNVCTLVLVLEVVKACVLNKASGRSVLEETR